MLTQRYTVSPGRGRQPAALDAMKFCLDGPYPFDVNAVTACGRAALSGVDRKLRAGLGEQLIEESYERGWFSTKSLFRGRPLQSLPGSP